MIVVMLLNSCEILIIYLIYQSNLLSIDLFVLHHGYYDPLLCWDPQCTHKFGWNYAEIEQMSDDYLSNSTLSSLSRVINVRENVKKKSPNDYIPGRYKYVVVPDGMGSVSTSSRLLHVLGHCDCVVLLVNSVLQFHFSGKLLPWVHYVPLATSGNIMIACMHIYFYKHIYLYMY